MATVKGDTLSTSQKRAETREHCNGDNKHKFNIGITSCIACPMGCSRHKGLKTRSPFLWNLTCLRTTSDKPAPFFCTNQPTPCFATHEASSTHLKNLDRAVQLAGKIPSARFGDGAIGNADWFGGEWVPGTFSVEAQVDISDSLDDLCAICTPSQLSALEHMDRLYSQLNLHLSPGADPVLAGSTIAFHSVRYATALSRIVGGPAGIRLMDEMIAANGPKALGVDREGTYVPVSYPQCKV